VRTVYAIAAVVVALYLIPRGIANNVLPAWNEPHGDCEVDCRLKIGCVSARARAGVRSAAATRKIMARRTNEYFSLRVVCMAVEYLQGELQGRRER